jgi:hypothetical protein
MPTHDQPRRRWRCENGDRALPNPFPDTVIEHLEKDEAPSPAPTPSAPRANGKDGHR